VTGEGSRLPQGAEEPPSDQDRGERAPRRFDLQALPGRHATYVLKVVSVALPVLALLAVGLFALSEWLALQPVPRATPTLPALPFGLATSTLEPGTISATANPLASVPTQTSTLTPKPTHTLVPLRTRTPRPTATPTSALPAATPVPAPSLLEPVDGVTQLDRVTFRWEWKGAPLRENQAFDVRIWSEQEELKGGPRRGAAAPTRDTQVEVDLRFVPAIQDFGRGTYYWTVIVVEVQPGGPPKEVGQWGEVRRLVYR
jgi:hypothetical protein